MYRLFTVVVLFILISAPVAASDKTDVMSVVHQFVSSFNKADVKSLVMSCAEQTVIIDDIPPHEWHGPEACSKWFSAFQAFAKATDTADPTVTIGKPWHIDLTGDVAYVVAPTTFSFIKKGKPVKELGILTVSLQKAGAVWRMTGWAWADH